MFVKPGDPLLDYQINTAKTSLSSKRTTYDESADFKYFSDNCELSDYEKELMIALQKNIGCNSSHVFKKMLKEYFPKFGYFNSPKATPGPFPEGKKTPPVSAEKSVPEQKPGMLLSLDSPTSETELEKNLNVFHSPERKDDEVKEEDQIIIWHDNEKGIHNENFEEEPCVPKENAPQKTRIVDEFMTIHPSNVENGLKKRAKKNIVFGTWLRAAESMKMGLNLAKNAINNLKLPPADPSKRVVLKKLDKWTEKTEKMGMKAVEFDLKNPEDMFNTDSRSAGDRIRAKIIEELMSGVRVFFPSFSVFLFLIL